MNPAFHTIDIIIFTVYLLIIVVLGRWVAFKTNKKDKTAEDYFLAGKSLPWWAIGASLIAANISAEQFIGMSGSGFAGGFAVASYEFMAALTLIIVAKFFMPVFIKQGIYTIPEFVEKRYSRSLRTILAVFWIGLFVFVNLTSVLFLGSKAIDTIIGTGDGSLLVPAIIGLAVIAASYSLRGGLSSVAWTDILQVILLVLGGIITTVVALHYVSPDGSLSQGVRHLTDVAGDRFHLVLSKDNPEFHNLPGIAMLIGGLWVANLYYWGFNQYIIQRAFAAKDKKTAKRGTFLGTAVYMVTIALIFYMGLLGRQLLPDVAAKYGSTDAVVPGLAIEILPIGLTGLALAGMLSVIMSTADSYLLVAVQTCIHDVGKTIHPTMSEKRELLLSRLFTIVLAFGALIVALYVKSVYTIITGSWSYYAAAAGFPALAALYWKKATTPGILSGILGGLVVTVAWNLLGTPFGLGATVPGAVVSGLLLVIVSLATCKKHPSKVLTFDE